MDRRVFWLLLFLNIAVLAPLLYLSYYDYPSADDFSYAINPSHLSLLQREVSAYHTWTSRYLATALLITSPLNHGTDAFFGIYPLVFGVLFYFGVAYLFKNLGILDRVKRRLLALSVVSVYTLVVPSIVNNYFWLAGSATYFLPCIFFIFYFSCLVRIFGGSHGRSHLALGIFSIFVMGGCVEVLIGFAGILTAVYGAAYYFKFKKINGNYAVFLLMILAEVIFIALCPGNKVRSESLGLSLTVWQALLMSIKKTLVINVRYLLFGFGFFLALLKVFQPKFHIFKSFKNIGAVFLFYNFLLFVGSFVAIYSLKYIYPLRVENMFVFTALVFVFLIAYLVYEKYLQRLPARYFAAGFSLLALVYSFATKSDYQRQNNLSLVYGDIFSGRVAGYDRQMKERKILMRSCTDCAVPAIKNPPYSILFKDIVADPAYYINTAYAEFYKVKSVKTKE